jgi:phospholipid transport system transporter-binding protein
MIERTGDTLKLSGAVTLAHAAAFASECRAHVGKGARILDWSAVTEVDSSALALILETQRGMSARLKVTGLPDSLKGLVALYGLTEVIAERAPA